MGARTIDPPAGDAAAAIGASAAPARGAGRLPAVACAVAVALAGVFMAWLGTRVTTFDFDEAHYRTSAVHYTSGLPSSFLHDLTAYATSRLYALTIMPLFAALHGDQAVRAAKVWNAALWCSAAIPLWLLARPVLTPWRRAAAVTLGVVAPWIVLTTVLFTESLAFAVFAWFTYAALQAVRRPAWQRDLAVMVAFAVAVVSRVQLAGCLAGYLLLIGVGAWRGGALGGGVPWWYAGGRLARYLRRFPFTVLALAGLVLAYAYLRLSGRFDHQFLQIFGNYAATKDRPTFFSDVFPMILVEVLAISAGVGLVAVLVGAPWYARTLAARVRGEAWWFAAATLCVGGALIAFTAYSQGAFWGPSTEERYFMYVFPFAWIAAFAAAQQRDVLPRDLAVVGAVIVTIAGAIGVPRVLDGEAVVLAPVMGTLGTLTSHPLQPITTTSRDELALLVLAVTVAAWLVVRRMPWLRLEWLLGAGAVAQLALTVVPVLAMQGHLVHGAQRTGGAPFAQLGWVDRAAGAGPVTWFSSEPHRDPALYTGPQQGTLFWSSTITSRSGLGGSTPSPDASPLDALPQTIAEVDPATGRLSVPLPAQDAVAYRDSPYQQLAGRVLATQPGGGALELLRLAQPARATFRSQGLAFDSVPLGADVKLDFWPADGRGVRAVIGFGPIAGVTSRVRIWGPHVKAGVTDVSPSGPSGRVLTLCGRHARVLLRGVAGPPGKARLAATVTAVALQPLPPGACPRP